MLGTCYLSVCIAALQSRCGIVATRKKWGQLFNRRSACALRTVAAISVNITEFNSISFVEYTATIRQTFTSML
jgi:hypothetical protein